MLLPLSGQFQSFGEPCFRGIRLALDAVDGRSPALRTIVVDTHGSAAEAAKGYQRLAMDPGVVAILGPMLTAELDAVRTYAPGFGLPVVSFSQQPASLPILRFTMTKEDSVRTLTSYVGGEQGLRRFAALYPDDAYGREVAGLFRSMVEAQGGRVVAQVAYDPAKTDLQLEARRLQARLGIIEGEPPPATPPVDAVFVPESAERLALIAPYLPFVGIRGVELLGLSGWGRPKALLRAAEYLNGGVFVDGFFLYSFLPEVKSFVDAFRDAYGSDPATLAAYGYDAAGLLRDLVLEGGVRDRQQMLRELSAPQSRPGATGTTTIRGGQVEKTLFVLTIQDGTIREVERAALAPSSGQRAPRPERFRPPEFDSRTLDRAR